MEVWKEDLINNRENRKFKKKKCHLLPSSVTISTRVRWKEEMRKLLKQKKADNILHTKLLPCIIRNNKLCKVPLKKLLRNYRQHILRMYAMRKMRKRVRKEEDFA